MRLLKKGYLKVGIHKIYYELRGKRDGVPAVYLHGGPGFRFKPKHFKNFPDNHRVLFFDQRGAGRSRPAGELKHNTTQDLVEDIAKLMDLVGFKRAKIVGGSWGSTLALCFAIDCPERVKKLVIGGIYLGTREENEQLVKNFELYSPQLSEGSRPSFYSKMDSKAVKRLHMLEGSIMDNSKTWKETRRRPLTQSDWIEIHYLRNDSFLNKNHIMRNVRKIANIPTVIIQGQQDLVCPPMTAWRLSKGFKKCRFVLVPAGHSVPGVQKLFRRYI